MEETQDIVINGVSVITIADYAKRRYLKVSFVQNHLIKGDDQNDPIKPVYKLGNAGMYSIEELDEAYLVRGSKGITLASMGYLHPGKAAEMESRIRELIQEKAEAEENLNDSETELEDVKARLFRAQCNLEEGEKQYTLLLKERDELNGIVSDLRQDIENS